jgi:hypothetical protein
MPQPQSKPPDFIPDEGKPDFIPDAGSSPPVGEVRAAPEPPWLDQLNNDLRMGGGRTLPGRVLGRMQGRGDKGFSGLETGGTAGAADTVASLPLGAVKTAQGISEHKPLKTIGGIAQMATIPGAFMGGPAAEAGIEAIPSRAYASHVLGDIGEKAANVPVSMAKTEPALGKFAQHVATGGQNADVMGKLGGRISTAEPINFPEARQFYTNVSDTTRRPPMLARMLEDSRAPRMRMAAGDVRSGLHSDLTNAAGTIGRGEDYQNAINEYANASRLNKGMKKAGMAAAGAGASALGAGQIHRFLTSVLK